VFNNGPACLNNHQLKAVETSSSMSELINNAVKESIIQDVEGNQEMFKKRCYDMLTW